MRFLFLLLLPSLAAQQTFAELPRHQLPSVDFGGGPLASIDIDGDGDRDLVLGSFRTGPLMIWRNDEKGRFVDSGSALPTLQTTVALAVGDVNGDGSEDLVAGTYFGGLQLLTNSGGNLFVSPGSLPPTTGPITAACLFDVDGDGDLDLIFGEGAGFGGTNRMLINNGTGRFTDATSTWLAGIVVNFGASQFVPFDCDGDGDRDVLVVSGNPAPLLLRNQGSSFAVTPLPTNLGRPLCAAAGDVDGDGDLDLVLGNSGSALQNQDRLLLNNGTGSFVDATATALPSIDNFTSAVYLTDVDGDGDLDLLVAQSQLLSFGSRRGHTLLRNNGAGIFSDASATLPDNDYVTTWSTVFDVDGDGDQDYLFASQSGVQLYWNDHGTLFDAAGPALPARFSVTDALAAGDLDGDGAIDLITGGWNFALINGRVSLLWNDQTGHFAESASNPTFPIGFYSSAAVGDLDGDGDLDLVLGLDGSAQNRIYRNDGNRAFTDVTATALPAALSATRAARLFDADGDGDLDILFGDSGFSRLLANNGAGSFVDVTSSALPLSAGTRDFAVGDVDGDGDLDLVRAVDGGANELLRNNGGVFQVAAGSLPTMVQSNEAIALADLDGDGDLDLIVGNYARNGMDARSWILWNSGNGTFPAPPVSLGSADVRAIAVGDIEGDGDIDFVLGGQGVAPRLFENLGNGSFLSQAGAMPSEVLTTARLSLVDADGDGDLDLVEADGGRDRVLTNLHRQLSSDSLFVPGSTARLRAFVAPTGPPGTLAAAAVFAGLPGTPTATPFGVAHLDLTTLLLLGFGPVVPPDQSLEVTAAVPSTPALLGLTVGLQVLAVHDSASLRLSNLVLETVRQ